MGGICLAACVGAVLLGADAPVRSDRPNAVGFPAQEAKYVRFVIRASSSSQPCLDELEVYGPDDDRNLALAKHGAKATASSCLAGYAIHQVAHLNDGRYGNEFSWIAAGSGEEWAQIELPVAARVAKVVFSRDRNRLYADRVPIHFAVWLSLDGAKWSEVKEVKSTAALVATGGRPGDFAGVVPGPPPPPKRTGAGARMDDLLRYAFLAEEHAWLKTFGRADLDQRLTQTAYRERRYPEHVGDDRLPLPPLADAPRLDGRPDDPAWAQASRGVVRVAHPYDFDAGPLVTHAVSAGHKDGHLWLAIQTDRLLSSHLAVVSTSDGQGCGVVACTKAGLVFDTYAPEGRGVKLDQSRPIEGKLDESLTCCEIRLPLEWLPECRELGIRVGLGMGAKHTVPEGRPVHFAFSPLAVAQVGGCVNRTFQVRLSAPPGGEAMRLRGNAPGLGDGLKLGPGEFQVVAIPADAGPIGPQCDLSVENDRGEQYVLHLFRYDPLERTLGLMDQTVGRLSAKGLDVGAERGQLAELRKRQQAILAAEAADPGAERQAFLEARLAKRRLLLRDPELAPIEDLLFVKRHAFEPSHNYSVILDSRFRPGGGVYTIHVPRREGRFEPGEAELRRVFDSGGGIARNPMANFDRTKIYFGYRPGEDGYYHVMAIDPDGGGLEQLTSGPFHDYWPCPLPDGGLAFISTRCRSRYLCWRPQAAVLFRMDADGGHVRPLSFANLTEWGPSVMRDGRIIWQRSEYVDKGADYSHTLWTIRPDGRAPELIFGNTIVLPQGYANGREVPGTSEICCTLISHFGDLNGPIALVDVDRGRFNPDAIRSITPEVPWPGAWPREECFRDPVPIARDYVLCSHAPRDQFGLFVIDRFGNRELVYLDPSIGSMCPTVYRAVKPPPVLSESVDHLAEHREPEERGRFFLADVYRGLEPAVARGSVKYLRVAEEVRSNLNQLADGSYQRDHEPFMNWYASPVDKVRGPFGWPSYVAKASWGIVPVEDDGSASFYAPAGKQLYFQVLDENFNEIQRMRSVVQVQPGEMRSCVGCHEDRRQAPAVRHAIALKREPRRLEPPPWGAGPFSYEQAVQPVLDARCAGCHNAQDKQGIDLSAVVDLDRTPASYRTLISQGWVHHFDFGWKSGENLKAEPLTFGTLKSKLWPVLDAGHYDVRLTEAEMRALKCWIDLNCPLWPDYMDRTHRPGPVLAVTGGE